MPTLTPPKRVQDFQGLIQWLADEYHDGAPSAMSDRLRVSVATPNFWRRGVVLPTLENMERLCQAYGLPFDYVRDLVWKAQQDRRRPPKPPIAGGSDIMSSSRRPIHNLWESTKEQVHILCLTIRLSAAQDRMRDLVAA